MVKDVLLPPEDSRRFFMLPQTPQDTGYYSYGLLNNKPAKGAYQYAHPLMMTWIAGWATRYWAA